MSTPATFRAIIADDERLARKRLRELLEYHPEIEVVAEADTVPSLVALANRECPDLIFLDVQMPPHSGFDAIAQIHHHPRIIFITAYDSFAVKAFETNAVDYLLKPVHPERLAETIRRLHAQRPDPTPSPEDRITLKDKGEIRKVPLHNIAVIQAEGDYSRIVTAGQKPLLILRTLQEWEETLPSPPFFRLDRSLLVNLNQVRSVKAISRNETHLALDGAEEPVILGRAASLRLKRLLDESGRS